MASHFQTKKSSIQYIINYLTLYTQARGVNREIGGQALDRDYNSDTLIADKKIFPEKQKKDWKYNLALFEKHKLRKYLNERWVLKLSSTNHIRFRYAFT